MRWSSCRSHRPAHTPWPNRPVILRTSSSHEEGCRPEWSILSNEFLRDDKGHVRAVKTVRIDSHSDEASGRQKFREVPGSEQERPWQLTLLAMGFVGPEKQGPIADLGLMGQTTLPSVSAGEFAVHA